MTIGEFKKWMTENGITDEMEIRYIDFSAAPTDFSIDETKVCIE